MNQEASFSPTKWIEEEYLILQFLLPQANNDNFPLMILEKD